MEKKQKKIKREDSSYEVTEGNVFEALGLDQPDELLARSKLLIQVGALIENSGYSQQEVAKKTGNHSIKGVNVSWGSFVSF
jgi:predicted XRE-type DNA-binding protein